MLCIIQERLSVLAAECASALLTFPSAHSCNPPEAVSWNTPTNKKHPRISISNYCPVDVNIPLPNNGPTP